MDQHYTDAKQIILETEETGTSASSGQVQSKAPRVRIDFLDTASLTATKSLRSTGAMEFEAAASGYADSSRGALGKVWLVTFGATPDQRLPLARVKSPCKPDLLFPSNETLLIGRCSPKNTGYSISVFTLGGQSLWRDSWNEFHHFLSVVRNTDGSRFAVASVVPNSGNAAPLSDIDDPVGWPDVQQEIRVFETASGHAVLMVKANTVVLKNRNFALSPDGTRLAVIDGTELLVFDLPQISHEERAQYLAVKANAPGLSAPTPIPAANNAASVAPTLSSDPELQALGVQSDKSAEFSKGAAELHELGMGTSSSEPNRRATLSESGAFRTYAHEVVVDIVVTGSKGHPVKGLSASTFRIEEDGKPQAISYLHEFDGLSGTAPCATIPAPAVRPDIFSNQLSATPNQPKIVLLLDLLNTPFADQQSTKQALLKFLKNRPAGPPFFGIVRTR